MNKKLQYFKLYSSCYLCIQQGFFFIIREFNLFVKYLNSIIARIDCATYLVILTQAFKRDKSLCSHSFHGKSALIIKTPAVSWHTFWVLFEFASKWVRY